jgi:hypothetical protein
MQPSLTGEIMEIANGSVGLSPSKGFKSDMMRKDQSACILILVD